MISAIYKLIDNIDDDDFQQAIRLSLQTNQRSNVSIKCPCHSINLHIPLLYVQSY